MAGRTTSSTFPVDDAYGETWGVVVYLRRTLGMKGRGTL